MLTSLRVANYRALRDLRIDELNRINLISGENNSGKTTLLESLLMLSAGHPDQLRVRASGTIAKQ